MSEKEAREKAALQPGVFIARISRDTLGRLCIEAPKPVKPGSGFRMVEASPIEEGEFVLLAPI